MILVDTAVVIDYARGKDAKLVALLPSLPVLVCGIVRAELLCGARDPKHRTDLFTLLATFGQLAIPDTAWDTVGDNLAALRSRGVTVPFPDAAIATLGIENDLEVWARPPFPCDAEGPARTQALCRTTLIGLSHRRRRGEALARPGAAGAQPRLPQERAQPAPRAGRGTSGAATGELG